MEDAEHPVIGLFRLHAEMMNAQAAPHDSDEAIVQLAAWIDSVQHWLTGDDLSALTAVGGIMYREQLRRRMIRRVK